MPRHCTVCEHPQLREITADLMKRIPYRTIEKKYPGVSRAALDRHLQRDVTKALQKLGAAEAEMSLADAAVVAAPVLGEMRKLNTRALRILADAEAAKDRPTALHAIRECRRNLELIAKLTGELDPRAAGETAGGGLQVTINYVDRQLTVTGAASPLPESKQLTGGQNGATEEAS